MAIKERNPQLGLFFDLGTVFFIGFLAIAYFYWTSYKGANADGTVLNFIFKFPVFLAFSMGLSLHNSIAVLEGFLGIKSPFIRTPKFNILSKEDSWRGKSYVVAKLKGSVFFEFLLALYFVAGISYGIYLSNYALIIFHFLLAAGFGSISILSFKSLANAHA